MKRIGWITMALVLATVVPVRADAPKGDFEVHDLTLWIVDNASPQANARASYASPFPASITSARGERSSAVERKFAPLGLLTFHGRPATDLDVDLRIKSGSFLSHLLSAETMPNRLRWAGSPGVALVEKLEDETELMLVEDDSWIRKARGGDALFVRRGARSERFLAYDAELNLATPVRLQGGPDKFTIANVSGGTLHDVLVARATPEGPRVAWIDVLPKTEQAKPAKPAKAAKPEKKPVVPADGGSKTEEAAKSDKPAGTTGGLFGVAAKPAAAAPPKEAKKAEVKEPKAETKDAAAKPATGLFGAVVKSAAGAAPKDAAKAEAKEASKDAPKDAPKDAAAKPSAGLFGVAGKPVAGAAGNDKPSDSPDKTAAPAKPAAPPLVGGVEVTLSQPLAAGSDELRDLTTKALTDRLAKTGLSATEVEVFVSQTTRLLFEGDSLVVLCRLEPGALDEKMPLSIFPEPTKVIRVPMVAVRNLDPQINGEVEQLIAQLGDPSFDMREKAQKRLLQLGPLAFEPLKKAMNHDDMEVVIRAERVLLNQSQPAVGRQGPVAAPAAAAPAAKPAAAGAAAPAVVKGVLKLFGK